VANKIDGIDVRPVRIAAGAPVRKTADDATGKAGSGASSPDNVQITSTARSLASLEQSIRDMPAIDQERVAEIEARLSSGKYQMDPQRVADGLLRLESDLRGLGRK
jgi:negative regulator of flagellin synthesis FlgM